MTTEYTRFAFLRYDVPRKGTSYWSGGSRSYFAAYNFQTRETIAVPQNGTPFDGGPIAPNGVLVPQNACIVKHSIYSGVDVGLTILVNPDIAIVSALSQLRLTSPTTPALT